MVTAYGAGSRPVVTGTAKVGVTVSADHVDVTQLTISGFPKLGVMVTGDHDRFDRLRVTNNAEGIQVAASAVDTRIERSRIAFNTKMVVDTPGGDADYGANGVVIDGTDAVVSDNFFAGNVSAHSYDYGRDGSAVEIYGGCNTVVENNIARDELVFSEVGGHSNNSKFSNNGLVSSLRMRASFSSTPRTTSGPATATT